MELSNLITFLITLPIRVLYRVLGLRYFYTGRQSVRATAELIRSVQKSLLVVSGELYGTVWDAEPVRQALTELTRRPNAPTIAIIVTASEHLNDSALHFLASLARQGKLSLYQNRTQPRASRHFWVADGRNVKIETPHEPNAEWRPGYVAFGAERLARTLEARFRFAKEHTVLLAV